MKKKKEPDPNIVHTDFFKSVKVPLQHVLKNPKINIKKIYDTVVMANKIVSNTLMFMKLYILNYSKVHHILPPINKEFVNSCMKILCTPKPRQGKSKQATKDLKDTLILFYNEHYKPLIVEDNLEYTYMNTILDYLTTDILTMYENNIKLKYSKYVERYVNVMWKKKFFIDIIKRMYITPKEKTRRIYQLTQQLKKIKNDLLTVEDTQLTSFSFYHEWIIHQRTLIRPNKVFAKNNLFYDIECDPFDYLPNMIFMMSKLESEDLKMFNVFPLRAEIVPKHITLDTTTLVHLMMTKKQGLKSDYVGEGNLKKNEDKIWAFFFRTERSCFIKDKYSFHHMIETDGVSCSILLKRKDLVPKKVKLPKQCHNTELYLDQENIDSIQNKKIIAIDPGLCDLIYCTDGSSKDSNTFRYSQDQRRKETKSKKFSKIILEFKKEIINDLSVIEHETKMSNYNKKTLSIEKFKEYILQKSKLNHILGPFYNKYIFRKLKLNGYLNIKRSEQRMINNFKKIFNIKDTKEAIVCFGDFEQKQHMKFKEPTKGVGMRKLFRSNGFKVYLVDEFRTSCRCANCSGETAKFMVRTNPKPYKDNSILVHGLLRCKNECRGLWNRDRNGSSNIYKICKNIVLGIERPLYLSRSQTTEITTQIG